LVFVGAVKNGGSKLDNGHGGGKGEAIEGAEAGIAAIFLDRNRIAADKDGAQANLAAEGFGDQMLTLDADDFGYFAAAANEGGAEFPDPGILATLYNADEARAIRSQWHGGILNLHLGVIDKSWIRRWIRGVDLLLDGRGFVSGDSAHPSGRA
jgi:hypothetical protein